MRLRELHVGCLGGGTGLPSLLGGLKTNPWLQVHAIVTMFDSGGSSGVLRDALGVLPPGDVLKCALALARDEGEARSAVRRFGSGLLLVGVQEELDRPAVPAAKRLSSHSSLGIIASKSFQIRSSLTQLYWRHTDGRWS